MHKKNFFQEIFCCARYGDDCITIWTRDVDKVNLLLEVLNSLEENLQFAMKIGGCLKITNYDKNLQHQSINQSIVSFILMVLRVIQQSIDGISTGVAKRLKRICSNDNDFLEQ